MTDGVSELLKQSKADDKSAENTDANQDQGTMFIGEGKKYSSVEDADKALAFKDDHISRIEVENAKLRDNVLAADKIDEVLQSIKAQQTVQESSSETSEGNHQGVDIDALVEAAINEKLTASDQARTSKSNEQEVVTELVKRYGANAEAVYEAKSKELGVDLNSLASQSPKVVLELFKDSKSTSTQTSTINSTSLGSGVKAETYEFLTALMKSGKITREQCFKRQHASLEAMGPTNFYGTS